MRENWAAGQSVPASVSSSVPMRISACVTGLVGQPHVPRDVQIAKYAAEHIVPCDLNVPLLTTSPDATGRVGEFWIADANSMMSGIVVQRSALGRTSRQIGS